MLKALTVPEKHQRNVALKTLRLSEVGARILGGPDHKESVKILRGFGMADTRICDELKLGGHYKKDIERYMQS